MHCAPIFSVDTSAIITWEEAREFRNLLHAEGKKLVFTNGCFDLLHVGHVRYLAEARRLGDALLVAVNADESVRALKGPHRPINKAEERAEVLRALRSVDRVLVFEEPRATRVLEAVAPHVYAKGGDYTVDSLNAEERAVLEKLGTEIRILSLVEGKSTSKIVAKMQPPIRLGVLGSGRGSTLEGLFQAIDEGHLHADVRLVLSDVADARILRIAEERGVEASFIDPGPHSNRFCEGGQRAMRERLLAADVQLVILAGFMRRIKAPLLSAFPQRILNVHPSLLPNFPGKEAWKQALDAGVRITGASVHLVDEGIDTGKVLLQEEVPILPGDTPVMLHERIQAAERRLFPRAIQSHAHSLGR